MRLLRDDTEHPNPIGDELRASTTAAVLAADYLDARAGRRAQPPPTRAVVCDPAP